MEPSITYAGPERRKNRVFLTRHTAYHCQDGICVAVRDVQTGDFIIDHAAIGRRICAGIRFEHGDALAMASGGDDIHVGERLWFLAVDGDDGENVLTTSVVAVVRPPKAVASEYTRRQRAALH